MKYIPTNHRNPCPICQDTSGDCRTTETGVVFCHDFIHSDSGVAGYIWKKPTSNDVWGIHAPDDGKEFDKEQYERHKAQKEAQRRNKKQFLADNALDADGRDKAIRKLARYVGLSDRSRQDLIRRGLSDRAIKDGLFFDVDPWQTFNLDLPTNLPGISYKGDRFTTKDCGYACPIFDTESRAIGWQLRVEGVTKGNKYKWAKSSFSSHLPTGELPITVIKLHENVSKTLYLVEGILKPYIASQTLNLNICGAAGGCFSGSPHQFKKTAADYDEFVITPDAGDLTNPQVMKRWTRQINFLKQFDKPIKVLWWGQASKVEAEIDSVTSSTSDIDEIDLETFSKAEYLSTEKFTQLSKPYCEAIEATRKEKQEKKRKDHTWAKLTSLTVKPWLEVNTPNLEKIGLADKLEPGHIYLVKSAKGTHKTRASKPLIDKFDNVYAWFSRIALGREECHKLGLTYKDELKKYEGHLKVGFCANSAHQFHPRHLAKNGLLFIDESDQGLNYILEPLCNKDGIRPAITGAFEAQLNAAIFGGGMAVFLSADNSDIEYDFLKKVAPSGCEVRVIVNNYKPQKSPVRLDTSNSPDGTIDEMLEKLKKGEPCFVIDDVKNGVKGCKSVAEYVRRTLPEIADKIVEINSDTTGTDDIKEYIKNINTASVETLLLICSPSIVNGISIENGHFKGIYAFCNGILAAKNAIQSLDRNRHVATTTAWVAEKGFNYEETRCLTPEEIKAHYQRNDTGNSKYLSSFDVSYDPLTDEWSSPWFELYCKYGAYHNLSMTDLRSRFKEQLELEGREVIEINRDDEEKADDDTGRNVGEGLKKSWGSINVAEARAVDSADILEDEEFNRLSKSEDPITPEQQLDLKKTLLLKQYGQSSIDKAVHTDKYTGEELTGYAALYLMDNGGKLYRGLKQLFYLVDKNDEAVRSDYKKQKRQQFHGARFASDITWDARKKKLREYVGLDRLIDSQWRQSSEFNELGIRLKKHPQQVKDVIGLSVKNIHPSQIYTALMRQLGLKTESKQVKEKTANGTRTVRWKRITPESLAIAELSIAHQEDLRLQRTTENLESVEVENAVTPPPIFLSNQDGGVLPGLAHTQQDLQPTKSQKSVLVSNSIDSVQGATETQPDRTEQSTTENSQNSLNMESAIANSSVDHQEDLRLQRTTENLESVEVENAVTPPPIFLSNQDGGVLPGLAHTQQDLQPTKSQKSVLVSNNIDSVQGVTQTQPDRIEQSTTENSQNYLFDTEESINDLASMLMTLEDAEGLAEFSSLKGAFSRSRLNRAVMRLSIEWQQRIRDWVAEWQLNPGSAAKLTQ